jgi:hypothetical protein
MFNVTPNQGLTSKHFAAVTVLQMTELIYEFLQQQAPFVWFIVVTQTSVHQFVC